MATLVDFQVKFEQITTGLDNIQADVVRLKDQIAGLGLSADVEAQLLATVEQIAGRVTSIADETPEPVVEPPVEG